MKERDRPRVGRKARRDGNAEKIAMFEGHERKQMVTALSKAGSFKD